MRVFYKKNALLLVFIFIQPMFINAGEMPTPSTPSWDELIGRYMKTSQRKMKTDTVEQYLGIGIIKPEPELRESKNNYFREKHTFLFEAKNNKEIATAFHIEESGWIGSWTLVGRNGIYGIYDIRQTKGPLVLTGKGEAWIAGGSNGKMLIARKTQSGDNNLCSYKLSEDINWPGGGALFNGYYSCTLNGGGHYATFHTL